MEPCEVLIVGGGPAGSSCAWKLRQAGVDAAVLDRARFPRDKVCAGWITPSVFQTLAIDPEAYGEGRTLQPFTGFLVGTVGASPVEVRYGHPVSYGIRRAELDHYLLSRSGAHLRLGEPLASLERSGGRWVANGSYSAAVVVGAGGHFCPTVRFLGSEPQRDGDVVVAQAAELEMGESEARHCPVDPETPELYFSPDLRGYGWCVGKGRFLNVGLGRVGERNLRAHVASFLGFLERSGRLPSGIRLSLRGHAYRVRIGGVAPSAGDGILWVGDAAGLADSRSGEGIGPAVESGILAAQRILAAGGDYRREKLLGGGGSHRTQNFSRLPGLPPRVKAYLGQRLLATRWFSRHVVLDRWFLGSREPSISLGAGSDA